jgi:hypothetical protein
MDLLSTSFFESDQFFANPTSDEVSYDPIDMLLNESQITNLQNFPDVVFPSLESEWQYKRGARKQQQYWVYCEGSQFNYTKLSLRCGNMFWSSNSRVMKRKNDSTTSGLVFVENINDIYSRAVIFDPCASIGFIETVTISELYPVSESRFELLLTVETDKSEPHHPQQGSSDSVQCSPTVWKTSCEYPSPFSFFCAVQFTNRAEGWFRLKASLMFDNQPFLESLSEPFMLNNPRMKKHFDFQNLPSSHVKFIQMYNQIPLNDLIQAGHSLGYSSCLIAQLIGTARKLYSSVVYCGKRGAFSDAVQPIIKRSFVPTEFKLYKYELY